MSTIYTKDLGSTMVSIDSSKIRNRSTFMTVSRFSYSNKGTPMNNSFSQGNMMAKISQMTEKLQELKGHLEIESLQVKQTRNYCQQISKKLNSLVQNKNQKMKGMGNQLQANCRSIRESQSFRAQKLKNECNIMQQNQQKAKDKFTKMKLKIESLQNILGYYSADERYIS